MDRFSIIVPMQGDHQAFDDTLASVLTTQPANAQIIVPHDGTYDDPYDLHREVNFVIAEGPGLAELLNAAIEAANSQFTAIVRPGIQLPESWVETLEQAFTDPQVGSVCGAVVAQEQPNRLVAAGVDLGFGSGRKLVGSGSRLSKRKTARLRPAGPMLWAGCYRTDLLKAVAPLCPQMHAMYLDLDIALAGETLGYESAWRPELVFVASHAQTIINESRQPHGREAERAKRRHRLGAGLASRLFHAAAEVVASPLNASLIQHAIGRLRPGNRRTDDAFLERLEQPTEQVTLPFAATAAPLRRAA